MTDCPNGDVRDALPDYLNDRLDSGRRREVESHLAGCAACRAELSLLRTLRATVQRAPAVDVEAIAASIPRYRAPVRRTWATSGRCSCCATSPSRSPTQSCLSSPPSVTWNRRWGPIRLSRSHQARPALTIARCGVRGGTWMRAFES